MCLVTILTAQVAFVMLQFDWTPIPALMLIIVGMLIGTFGIGSFYTIMLPFALDQMIGASAEQLSAVVHWYCWGLTVGNFFQQKVQCVPIPNQLQYLDILPVIFLTLATLCFSAVLIMDCLYHKWLDTNNKTGIRKPIPDIPISIFHFPFLLNIREYTGVYMCSAHVVTYA